VNASCDANHELQQQQQNVNNFWRQSAVKVVTAGRWANSN